MKSIINFPNSGAILLMATLAACSSQPENKATQLEGLKKEQAELSKKIESLEKEIAKENPDAVKKVKMKDVKTIDLTTRSFDHYVQTQGTVVAVDNIVMSVKAAGLVTNVYTREGENVEQGQVMAQIDNSLIIRSIDEVKSGLTLANTVYERQKNLWDQKIGTEIQFLQAKNSKESLERRLATLQEQNEMTKVKAPISGVIDAVFIKVGENTAPMVPAFRLVNTSNLKASATVSETFVTTVQKGNKAIVTFPEMDKTIDANVSFVGRSIDPLSRSFPLEIKLPSAQFLRPNMTAVLKVIFRTEPNALCVPVNVVQDINGEKVVYTAESDGKNLVARKNVVEVDGVYGAYAQIKKGLKAGDKIITVGYQGLNDGELVKL
ncbi:RND transporter [Cytophagales bacterium WSM2-2]|nr:RND transporter [Cytophagales bacterium WSM2-2]